MPFLWETCHHQGNTVLRVVRKSLSRGLGCQTTTTTSLFQIKYSLQSLCLQLAKPIRGRPVQEKKENSINRKIIENSINIYLSGFHTRCLYWVSRRSTPRSHYSPSPPMKLMTSQSLPPSSASSVMIMSHRIDLAGLGHRKNSLTLHCFLT